MTERSEQNAPAEVASDDLLATCRAEIVWAEGRLAHEATRGNVGGAQWYKGHLCAFRKVEEYLTANAESEVSE